MTYLLIFLEFFKTGLFSVGGGLATLPFLQKMSEKYPEWFSAKDIADMLAISESTPGPIGVNMATYAGFNVGGALGSVISTIGLVMPSVIVIVIVAKFLDKFSESKYVKASFYGLRPAVTSLITLAGLEVFKIAVLSLDKFYATKVWTDIVNLKNLIMFLIFFAAIKVFKKQPLVYIVCGAVLGIILKL
jgi:chromate transporter